jgi:hypothetical protein
MAATANAEVAEDAVEDAPKAEKKGRASRLYRVFEKVDHQGESAWLEMAEIQAPTAALAIRRYADDVGSAGGDTEYAATPDRNFVRAKISTVQRQPRTTVQVI